MNRSSFRFKQVCGLSLPLSSYYLPSWWFIVQHCRVLLGPFMYLRVVSILSRLVVALYCLYSHKQSIECCCYRNHYSTVNIELTILWDVAGKEGRHRPSNLTCDTSTVTVVLKGRSTISSFTCRARQALTNPKSIPHLPAENKITRRTGFSNIWTF